MSLSSATPESNRYDLLAVRDIADVVWSEFKFRRPKAFRLGTRLFRG
jgi:hypothetical protein